MLDPLGVALGGFGVEAQAQQESQHDLVPPTAFPGQRAALVGEEHGPIPRPGDQALPGQTVERLGHRRDPDAKPRGDIHRPRLAVVVDQFGDQFDIVLGQLAAARRAHALERLGPQVGGSVIGAHAVLRIDPCHHRSIARDGLTSKAVGRIVSTI